MHSTQTHTQSHIHMRTQSITVATLTLAILTVVTLSGCASNSNRPQHGTELMDQLPPHIWAYNCSQGPRCVQVPVIVVGEDQIATHGSKTKRDWPRTGNDLTR